MDGGQSKCQNVGRLHICSYALTCSQFLTCTQLRNNTPVDIDSGLKGTWKRGSLVGVPLLDPREHLHVLLRRAGAGVRLWLVEGAQRAGRRAAGSEPFQRLLPPRLRHASPAFGSGGISEDAKPSASHFLRAMLPGCRLLHMLNTQRRLEVEPMRNLMDCCRCRGGGCGSACAGHSVADVEHGQLARWWQGTPCRATTMMLKAAVNPPLSTSMIACGQFRGPAALQQTSLCDVLVLCELQFGNFSN